MPVACALALPDGFSAALAAPEAAADAAEAAAGLAEAEAAAGLAGAEAAGGALDGAAAEGAVAGAAPPQAHNVATNPITGKGRNPKRSNMAVDHTLTASAPSGQDCPAWTRSDS